MRKSSLRLKAIAGAGVLAFGTLAACGSSSSGGNDNAGPQVGVILPDAVSSPRWEGQDRPNLQAAFDKAGIKVDIQNAQGDTAKFGQLCDSMINEGVKVLIETDLDSDSGTACLQKAQAAGVQTIDYDRLTLGGGRIY